MSLTSQIEKPATSSRASANGPSMTVRLATVEGDALGLRARLEAGGGDKNAGLHQFLGEFVHRLECRQHLGGGRQALFAVLGGFHQHHHPHRLSPGSSPPLLASHRNDERTIANSTSSDRIF
jgi:hypothetical protein